MKHFLIFAFVILSSFIFGQGNKKYALIQHFTNTRCGVCANNNPTYYANIQSLQANVHHISIHPSVPYNNCALYLANTAEQDVLRNYYSVFGTPSFFVNGVDKSLSSINSEVIATSSLNSPIALNVTQSVSSGSLSANVSVNTTIIQPTGSYILYVAAVEKLLNYNAPNGETQHHDVFRKMFTSASGQTISLTASGLQTFNFSTDILANWNASEMYVLAWVQNSVTKQVLNSANIFTPAQIASLTISTPNMSICSGANATFIATTTNGGTNPSFQWKKNGINTGTNNATFNTSSLVNGDIITCTLTSNDPFVSNSIVNSNSINPTITPSVTPTINISTSNTTICTGTNTTFIANGTNGGNAPAYQWKLNGNPVGSNSINYSNNALMNGDIISCTFTGNATCSTTNNVPSNSLNMIVNPIVSPSIAISTPITTTCNGSSLSFNANITFGGSLPGYQWKKNGSNVGLNSMTYVDNTLTNGDIIACTLTSNAACTSTNIVNSNTLPITVNPSLTPAIEINTMSTSICANTNVLFSASASNGGLNPSYQWKKNGSNVGLNSLTYVDNTLANGDIITCTFTSNAACTTTNIVNSNTLPITVNTNVTPTLVITSNADPIVCAGTSVTFISAQNFGGSSPAYQWKKNDVPVGFNDPNYVDADLKNGDVISCTMVSNASCVTTLNVISNSITMNVVPKVIPEISIMAASYNICTGSMVTFTGTQTNGGSSPTYQWKLNGSNVGTNSNVYSNVTLNDGDLITCVLTTNLTCVTRKTAHSNVLKMTVNAIETPTIVISSSANNINIGTKVVFTALTSNGGTSPVYQWELNGNTVGTNSQTYIDSTLTNGDIVTCVLTSNAPCLTSATITSNSIKITLNTVSVLDETIVGVKIFPVPANDHIGVELIDLRAEVVNIFLYNMMGQIVGKAVINQGNTDIKFDVSHVPDGEYLLKITNDSKTFLKKVVILK